MKYIKPVTALAVSLFLAASLTACGSSDPAAMKTLDTPAKASLSAASSEEGFSPEAYAGEYIMFGLGNMLTNIQNKKLVVSNENKGAGSVILNSDGTGTFTDKTSGIDEPVTSWSVSDGSFSMSGASFIYSGTLKDGILTFGKETAYYFAKEGVDTSSYSIVADDEYKAKCMTGTYYLTKETKPDESVSLSRTDISWAFLKDHVAASLTLNEDGTGALDTGDHHDITWDTEKITLDDQEYSLTLRDGIIALDMKDYTLEFSYISEEDNYLQLTWDEVSDSVEKDIPGKFYSIGESGFEYYVPDSYTMPGSDEEQAAEGIISSFVEQVDTDSDAYWDNDIYVYAYTDQVNEENVVLDLEKYLDFFETDSTLSIDLVTINDKDFICTESFDEEYNAHIFEFFTVLDNGAEIDILYRTEHSIMNDAFRALVYKLASSIRVTAE